MYTKSLSAPLQRSFDHGSCAAVQPSVRVQITPKGVSREAKGDAGDAAELPQGSSAWGPRVLTIHLVTVLTNQL